MSDAATQNLNVSIGAILNSTLAPAFRTVESVMARLEAKVKQGANALANHTQAQIRNTTAAAANANALANSVSVSTRAGAAAQRLAQLREKEARAARESTMENSKLARVMQSMAQYANSDKYVQHKQMAGAGIVAGAGAVSYAAKQGAPLEDQIIQSIITDGKGISALSPTRQALGSLSTKEHTGQTMEALAEGMGIYTAANMNLDESLMRLKNSGRVATATGSSVGDIARTELAMKSMFQITGNTAEETAANTKRAWNILAVAGKEGSFELRDMAKELTEVGSRAQNMHMTGETNLAYIAANLQAQVKNAGDPRTAANNLVNFMDKLNNAEDFRENAQKMGINMTALKQQAYANPNGPNVMELFVDRFSAILDRAPEAKRGEIIGKLVQDRQAREGLLASIQHRKSIEATKQSSLKGAESDVISQDYATAMEASAKSWESINSSMTKLGQAATITFAPTLKLASSVLEVLAGWTLSIVESGKGLFGFMFPVVTILGGIAAIGLKIRLLGGALNFLGASNLGQKLMQFPRLSTMIASSFRWMGGVVSGVWGRLGGGLMRLQFYGAMLMSRIGNAAGPMMARVGSALSGMWGRLLSSGGSILARLGPMLARLGPWAARGGMVLLRGLGTVLVRGVGLLFGTLGSVILAAITGWQIGTWINDALGLDEIIGGWWAKLTGLQKRMDELAKPIATADMNVGRLGMLQGADAQLMRQKAIAKWEEKSVQLKAKLEAKKSEWFQSDADKQEQAQLATEIKNADGSVENLRSQIARQNAGKTAFGEGPNAIRAAEMQLKQMEQIAQGGKDVGDIKASDATRYAQDLRNQLSQMKGKSAVLNGAANSSTHTTTLTVDVTGVSGPDGGRQVADAIDLKLRERDREVARAYRGVAATGNLE